MAFHKAKKHKSRCQIAILDSFYIYKVKDDMERHEIPIHWIDGTQSMEAKMGELKCLLENTKNGKKCFL